jgi:protein-disulfide isomerase
MAEYHRFCAAYAATPTTGSRRRLATIHACRRMGAKFPRVTILEFVDYACGPSRKFAPALNEVMTKHAGEVALVIRHLPLHGGPSAFAARAAVCASGQGKFEPYHRLLMSHAMLQRDSLVLYASRVGVPDTIAFRTCMGRDATASVVAADVSDANTLGVKGTPTILVNGEEYAGGQPLLGAIVARHLREHRAP